MRIALYHNLTSGGSKREAYEFTRILNFLGNRIDLYAPKTANEDFLTLKPYLQGEKYYPLELLNPVASRMPGLRKYVDFARIKNNLKRLDNLSKMIAQQINNASYQFAFLHHDQVVQSPFLLKYLQTPSVYYCAEPMRRFYEPGIPRPQPVTGWLDRIQERWYAPAFRWSEHLIQQHDFENVQHADLLLTNSFFSAESIYRCYGLRSRVVYLGVDEQKFCPAEDPFSDYVLSVGAISPLKGYDFLIQALAKIPENQRPKLVIAGNTASNAETQYLNKLASGLSVQLEFEVDVSETRLVELYQGARIFVYSPVLEPFGLAPLEAMACGVPVVAVKEGGVRESALDGVTGFLVERVPELFADALKQLLENPELRSKMGKNGREHILNFWTWEHATHRFLDVVTSTLNLSGG